MNSPQVKNHPACMGYLLQKSVKDTANHSCVGRAFSKGRDDDSAFFCYRVEHCFLENCMFLTLNALRGTTLVLRVRIDRNSEPE
jgi:hypothetical protein